MILVRVKGPLPVRQQGRGELFSHGLTHSMYALRINLFKLFGDIGLRRQRQYQLFERGVQSGATQYRAQRRNKCLIEGFGFRI